MIRTSVPNQTELLNSDIFAFQKYLQIFTLYMYEQVVAKKILEFLNFLKIEVQKKKTISTCTLS